MADSGDTAWMITATALVLLMTIPGLALFYAGMVRVKNALSVLMQCFAISALVSVLWMVYGYSLAFDTTGMTEGEVNLHSFVGGLGKAFMSDVTVDSLVATIPESVFATFQLTFAIITPALIVGAFAERMKFSALLLFTALWFTFVYAPGRARFCWRHGRTHQCGDCGPRGRFGARQTQWLSEHGHAAANGTAGMAMLVTQIATAAAALAWMGAEWAAHGKPSALGIVTGAIVGLVAITPASGTARPAGALLIGGASGVLCFFAAARLKRALGYDDSLDVFGVHAVGGIVGAILTGVCAGSLGGVGLAEGMTIGQQVWVQTKSVLLTLAFSGILTFIILKLLNATVGLRVTREQEVEGLDLALHDERAYNS